MDLNAAGIIVVRLWYLLSLSLPSNRRCTRVKYSCSKERIGMVLSKLGLVGPPATLCHQQVRSRASILVAPDIINRCECIEYHGAA